MKYFYGIVHKDEGSAFGVSFPDLPGCFSAADDIEDLVPSCIEAISLWIEDQPPPDPGVEPRPIEAIRAAAADELADGAFLLAVPWIAPSGKLTRVNLSVDEAVIAAIDQAARRHRQTRSAFMVNAARERIARG